MVNGYALASKVTSWAFMDDGQNVSTVRDTDASQPVTVGRFTETDDSSVLGMLVTMRFEVWKKLRYARTVFNSIAVQFDDMTQYANLESGLAVLPAEGNWVPRSSHLHLEYDDGAVRERPWDADEKNGAVEWIGNQRMYQACGNYGATVKFDMVKTLERLTTSVLYVAEKDAARDTIFVLLLNLVTVGLGKAPWREPRTQSSDDALLGLKRLFAEAEEETPQTISGGKECDGWQLL